MCSLILFMMFYIQEKVTVEGEDRSLEAVANVKNHKGTGFIGRRGNGQSDGNEIKQDLAEDCDMREDCPGLERQKCL